MSGRGGGVGRRRLNNIFLWRWRLKSCDARAPPLVATLFFPPRPHRHNSHTRTLTMTITRHTLNDASSFPKNVQEIVNLLHQPPPCEGSHSVPKNTADEKLDQIPQLIAFTCASMNACMSVEDDLGPRHTRPIWHNFLGMVARTMNQDTIQA